MIDRIIQFSIRNKAIIGLFTVVLLVYGGYSLTQLPIDAVPDITNNQVQVITNTPTLAAQEVEQFVTAPIERSMASLPDLVEIRSISRFGLSLVTIVFDEKVDIYFARTLVDQRLAEAIGQIPAGVGDPFLAPVSTGLGEIYQYALHPQEGFEEKFSPAELRTIQDWVVARQLIGTPGVAEVNSFGGVVKQYEVSVDPKRLQSMGVTIGEVFTALESNNENTGGAYIDKRPNSYSIRGNGLLRTPEDIGQVVVKNGSNGVPLLVRDVATVGYGSAPRYGALTRNGEGEVVGGMVLMLKGGNSSNVVAAVKERIPMIQKSLPEGLMIEPYLDRTSLVDRAIGTVKKNLVEGALIVIFVLVLFLGNWRAGLIVASVIPLSMLFAIILMNLFGVSGNLMSLGAIDFGLIVDGAVIIVEATLHHLQTHFKGRTLTRKEMDREVYVSASRIRSSAAFGEIIILIVYIPILTLIGIEGKMFRPMATVVSFAILGALLLSLTYVPMMSALALSRNTSHKRNFSDRMMERFQRWYDPIIWFALRNQLKVITVAVLLFIASAFAFSRMGGEFIPTLEEGDFAFHSILPQGASLSMSIANNEKVEKILMKFPEVKQVVGRTGSAEIPTDPMPPEATDLLIILKEKDEWVTAHDREALQDTMLNALRQVPGVFFEATQPIQMRFNELMTGIRQDVAVKIYGENMDSLAVVADKVAAIVGGVEGAGEPQVERVAGLPQITVTYDRARVAQYGLNVRDLNRTLRTAFAGETAGAIYENERRFDLVVRMPQEQRQSIDDVSNLLVAMPRGGQIALKQLARVELVSGPAQIGRENAKRRIVIGVNVRGRDVESFVEEVMRKMDAEVKLPSGYYYTFGGTFENLRAANKRLMVAVPVALALIYLLLYFTFASAKRALLIYTAIPMSAIGGVAALLLRDMPFSISAGVGFIALFGVAVLNGIVLIATFDQLEKEGITDLKERVLKGTRMRLRPVLMTAAVASLGFLPMALSGSAGAEVQRPLATVVIGGLVSATALTLVVLPVLYLLFLRIGRPRAPKAAVVVATMIAVLIGSKANAQAPVPLTIDSCVAMALRNAPMAEAARLQVRQAEAAKGNAVDIGQTTLFYENEDLTRANPESDGILKVGLAQSIRFPTVYMAQSKAAKAGIELAKSRQALTERELAREVRLAYLGLLYATDRLRLMQRQDSTMAELERSGELRFSTGESSGLERLSVQARRSEATVAMAQAQAEMYIAQATLRQWMNSAMDVVPVEADLPKLQAPASTGPPASHPMLDVYQRNVDLLDRQKRVEKNRLLPDLNARVFDQRLYGVQEEFYGYSVGIGIPLGFWSFRSRIRSADFARQAAEQEALNARLRLTSETTAAQQRLEADRQALSALEGNGLRQADELLRSAGIAYPSGEIGYIEYTALITQAIGLRDRYLGALHQYDRAVVQLNYLLNP
ncbi:MAG: CusA/CzcA family heavy metal efflux RND transporter [Bacteroidetes bacterium]|nr:CusA/CzcA family heavy metal efflux RND transporter [Bacteroidota bacterium]